MAGHGAGQLVGSEQASNPDVRVEKEFQLCNASHSSVSAAGSVRSAVMRPRPANAPSHLGPADVGGGGITSATGLPRRVMTMDRPVRRTRSRTARQVALNSEIAICSVFVDI